MRVATGLDLETTGLLDPAHRIIEAALIAYDLDTGVKLASFVKRWNPGRPIDPKATAVHGIRFDDVAHLPLLEDDPDSVQTIMKLLVRSDVVIAHNGQDFDIPFLRQELARIGKAMPEVRLVDTMRQARWATPLGKNPNLGELCFATRVPYETAKAHAADYDVDVMMACFFKAFRQGFYSIPGQEQLKEAA